MFFKELISLLIVITMLFSMAAMLFSCAPALPDEEDPPITDTPGEGDKEDEDEKDEAPASPIVVPPYKDYGKGTENFAALSYLRPNVELLVDKIAEVTDAITKNEIPYSEQLAMLDALGVPYEEYVAMMNMAYIFVSRDSSSAFWNTEHTYATSQRAKVSQAVDDMYIAAARSPHVESFDTDYYGGGLYEDYFEKESYSDALVKLYEKEAELEGEYNGLSTSNITLTYNGESGTFEELLEWAKEKYGTGSRDYQLAVYELSYLYEIAYIERSQELFLELVKVRRNIADEAGVDNYTDIVYENHGYAYTSTELMELLDDIGDNVYPVYRMLAQELYSHLSSSSQPTLKPYQLINSLYAIYQKHEPDIAAPFAYMLQHGLHDISIAEENRYAGAFVTHLPSNNSPFLFASVNGNMGDFATLSHEFGHFYDCFTNDRMNSSLEAAEVSSQALEYLTLTLLKVEFSDSIYKSLKYQYIASALETLVYQSIYAAFEHKVYALEYSDITMDNVNLMVAEACRHITGSEEINLSGYNPQVFDSLDDVLIPHFLVAPVYVQSYVTSLIPSLNIYFMEVESRGDGFKVYKELIANVSEDYDFIELLGSVGISSPFDTGVVAILSENLIKHVSGIKYKNPQYSNAA